MGIAYGVSWPLWLLSFAGGGDVPFLAGVLGPGIAAYVVLRLRPDSRDSLRAWARSVVHWRVPLRWWAYALGLPVLLFGAVSLVLQVLGRPVDWGLAVDRAPAYAATWLFVLVLGGGLEELGWRGYGLPHLLRRHTPVRATLILGLVWGVWHVPIYGPLGFLVPMLLAFFYTFLWARTGSVLLCIVLHASFTPAQDHLILLSRDEAYSTALDAPDLTILAVYLTAIAVLLLLTRGRLGVARSSVPGRGPVVTPPSVPPSVPPEVTAPARRHGVALLPLLLVAALVLPSSGTPTGVGAVEPDRAVDVLAEHLAAAGIPGGAVVTVTRGGAVEARGVGETAEGGPVTGSTPFVIGSTTKSFTALAVMQLVEDGSVGLDDPVTRYVPALELAEGEPVDEITVRHLLQQTSGLDDLAGGPVLGSAREGTALEAVAELADARLSAAPGVRWDYANVNYVLAGLVVEAAGGRPYADHLRERVLEPLGMDDTYVGPDPAVVPGHRYWFGMLAPSGPVQRDGMVAAGYLASSAEDLGAYLAMYLRDGLTADGTRLLSADGIRTLTTPGPAAHLGPWAEGAGASYAMGWMVGGPWGAEGGEQGGQDAAVFHPGNSPDSSAMIALFPDRGLGAAVLVPAGHELPVPGNPSLTDRISRATLHGLLGEEVPEPTSRWGFYLWFDLGVLLLVGLALWRLVAALAAYRRRDVRRARWLRPIPALLVTVVLVALPFLTSTGWAGVWTWAPDLGVTLLVLTAVVAATAVLRLLDPGRTRREGSARGQARPSRSSSATVSPTPSSARASDPTSEARRA